MASPSRYAKLVPRLRILRAGLLGERVRELGPGPAEALAALRDTIYAPASEAKDAASFERALARVYYSLVDEVASMSPDEARPVVEALPRVRELEDLMTVARSLAEVGRPPEWVPSVEWPRSALRRVLEELEASPTLSRLFEAASQSPALRPHAAGASEAFGELKTPAAFTWYSFVGAASIVRSAVASASGIDRDQVEKVLCPVLEGYAAQGLVEAWALRANPRAVTRALEGPEVCGIRWPSLASAYERGFGGELAPFVQEVAELFRYVRLEGRTPQEVMASARRSWVNSARRAADAAFSGYPFTPALAAAAIVLLTIDVDSVRLSVGSLLMGLRPEEFQQAIP